MHGVSHDVAAAQTALDHGLATAERHTSLGMTLFEQREYNAALACFERALALDPQHAAAWNGIGRVRYHTGPPEAAVAAYTQAIAVDPHYIPGYWGLGILYYAQLGAYDDALAIFRRGLQANPGEVDFYDGIGDAYARSGRFDEALAAYRTAAQHNPEVFVNIGILNLNLGNYEQARADFQRVIDHHSDQAWNYRLLGFAYDRLGHNEQAITALERAVALDPSDYEARGALARVYRNAGREQEAREQLALGRAQAAFDDEYAQACFEATCGDLDTAVELLRTALAFNQLTPGWARLDPEFVFLQGYPPYE
ncbi:MAG TPA: tetratricopeptide repeat protein, partial [Roseiflexaceae bacterium]|nr:tetratricopeptide repeat protein [Roseiflexaceae bacterium]